MNAAAPHEAQRLAFGRAATLYDRVRPSYPPAAIDAVIHAARLQPPARILEVGAGTGKATVLLAARGLRVIGLEPSGAMAAVARANCKEFDGVEIAEVEFERWQPRERLPALVCAASWHWISPASRYRLASAALLPGGTLAAMWTFPAWTRCATRHALSDAYRAAAPDLAAEFPMHPDSAPDRLAGDWRAEIDGSESFTGPVLMTFPWEKAYTSAEYVLLLQTHQDHILLEEPDKGRLLAAVADTIDAVGGIITMPYTTLVCLATRR
ncbi:MAG TPA: class I SAM-dependent methyltransferase [Solirubrobacteraceae bacterium]|nr:class I SAM-dependent methyltransferase [Solirubrobacteraceae bacterium]